MEMRVLRVLRSEAHTLAVEWIDSKPYLVRMSYDSEQSTKKLGLMNMNVGLCGCGGVYLLQLQDFAETWI
jgi:hypothetical protein